MQTDPMSILSKEDLDRLNTGPLFANQRSAIFEKYSQNPLTQAWEASQSPQDFKKDPAPLSQKIRPQRPPSIEEQVAQVLSGPNFPGKQTSKFPQQPMRMPEPVGPVTDTTTMPSMPTTGIASLSDVLPLLGIGGEDIMQLLSDLPKTPPPPVQPPAMPIAEEILTERGFMTPIKDPRIKPIKEFIEEERPPMDYTDIPSSEKGPHGNWTVGGGTAGLDSVASVDPAPVQEAETTPVQGMTMEQMQQMIADMQAQQQEQAATRAAQEKEMTQNYMVPTSRMGYNPYLSGQYQSDPYGPSGVPNMGGITTIPVPDGYGIYNPVYGG